MTFESRTNDTARTGKSRAIRVIWTLALGLLLSGACSQSSPPDRFAEPHAGRGGDLPGQFNNPDGGAESNTWTSDAAMCGPDQECSMSEGPDASDPPDPPDRPTRDAGIPPGDPVPSEDASTPSDATPDAQIEAPPEPDAEVEDPDTETDAGDDPTPSAATYKVDLLFVVDNSGSMREEQIALRAQFPLLISRLLENAAIGGGDEVVAGAQDIHLGVVSSDMGAVGIAGISGCSGVGDDGILQNVASVEAVGCSASIYAPPFLSYVAGTDDAAQLATDLGCISTLGTEGCGFEQQLESALKAVWPGDDDRVTFLSDGTSANGQSGLGFPNADFIRSEPEDPSVVAIVLVTDEEDCSSSNTAHLRPIDPTVPADSPLRLQGLNTRCFWEGQRAEPNGLFDVTRYVNALRALRPGQEHMVVFGAIAGVPPELVTRDRLAAVDFGDAAERDAFYAALLSDPGMQEAVDDRGTPEVADDSMVPSCRTASGSALAYAPRRIVQVAQGFEQNGFVQSICSEDWSPAMELLATRIAEARRTR